MSTGFSLARWFQEGGWGMFLLLALLLPTLTLGVLHAVFARRWSAIASWAMVGLALALGAGLMMHARATVERVLPMVSPDLRDRLMAQGMMEARRPLEMAMAILVLDLPALIIGGVRRFLLALDARSKENP